MRATRRQGREGAGEQGGASRGSCVPYLAGSRQALLPTHESLVGGECVRTGRHDGQWVMRGSEDVTTSPVVARPRTRYLGNRSNAALSTAFAASRCPCASSSSASATRKETTSGTEATASVYTSRAASAPPPPGPSCCSTPRRNGTKEGAGVRGRDGPRNASPPDMQGSPCISYLVACVAEPHLRVVREAAQALLVQHAHVRVVLRRGQVVRVGHLVPHPLVPQGELLQLGHGVARGHGQAVGVDLRRGPLTFPVDGAGVGKLALVLRQHLRGGGEPRAGGW